MRLRFEALSSHLQNQFTGFYIVSGDEPFQLGEAARLIREAAQTKGFTERQVFHIERGFDWQQVLMQADSLSLFAERKLVELRLPTGKPGTDGAKILQQLAEQQLDDTVFLLVAGKLDAAQLRAKWVKAIEAAGTLVQIWPVETARLPQWVRQRMQARQLQADAPAIQLLVERIEGNLLAADQEIEKLRLLYGEGHINTEQVREAVADSARYDVFTLVDEALKGDVVKTTRILQGLRAEGVEPILVLWSLARETRQLLQISQALLQGSSAQQAMARFRVWDKRKALVNAALQRLSCQDWQQLLRLAGMIDRQIKGLAAGRVWDELLELSLAICGQPMVRTNIQMVENGR